MKLNIDQYITKYINFEELYEDDIPNNSMFLDKYTKLLMWKNSNGILYDSGQLMTIMPQSDLRTWDTIGSVNVSETQFTCGIGDGNSITYDYLLRDMVFGFQAGWNVLNDTNNIRGMWCGVCQRTDIIDPNTSTSFGFSTNQNKLYSNIGSTSTEIFNNLNTSTTYYHKIRITNLKNDVTNAFIELAFSDAPIPDNFTSTLPGTVNNYTSGNINITLGEDYIYRMGNNYLAYSNPHTTIVDSLSIVTVNEI